MKDSGKGWGGALSAWSSIKKLLPLVIVIVRVKSVESMQAPVALQLLSVPSNHHHLLIRSPLLLCAALAWPAESRQLETMTAAGLNNLTKPQKYPCHMFTQLCRSEFVLSSMAYTCYYHRGWFGLIWPLVVAFAIYHSPHVPTAASLYKLVLGWCTMLEAQSLGQNWSEASWKIDKDSP